MMNKDKPLLKNGIWLKEQQGQLTIGSLDDNDDAVMVVPDDLFSQILELESSMIEALYGEERNPFNPAVVDIGKLLAAIEKEFRNDKIRTSFSDTKDSLFKGDYDTLSGLMKQFVMSSLPEASDKKTTPVIYINASVIRNHLCIIYRDSGAFSNPKKLKDEIEYIQNVLKGEINYKVTDGGNAYYDIMIPSR